MSKLRKLVIVSVYRSSDSVMSVVMLITLRIMSKGGVWQSISATRAVMRLRHEALLTT